MNRLLFAVLLLLQPVISFSQNGIDREKLDSLSRSIEDSRKEMRAWQDSFNKKQDSLYRAAQLNVDFSRNIENISRIMEDNKKREETRKQRSLISIGIAVVFFIVLSIVLFKRKKRRMF